MIWNSNFDRELSNAGRGVENNFKEKINGDGLQALFKSNKIGLDIPSENNTTVQNQADKVTKPAHQS